jgi:hypothetical protein
MKRYFQRHILGPLTTLLVWEILTQGPIFGKEPGRPFAEVEKEAGAKSPAVRRNAAHALVEFPKQALPVLIKLLQDKDAGVRRAAVRTVKMIVSESSPLTVYGPAESGLVLVPDDNRRRGPAWSGAGYLKAEKPHAKKLIAQLKRLLKDEPKIRGRGKETLDKFTVRLTAAAVVLKNGRGKPLLKHPKGKARVKDWELQDAKGKRLANLNPKGFLGDISCWAFSLDGRLLAVGYNHDDSKDCSRDYTIRGWLRVYDTATGDWLGDAGSLFGPIKHLAFSKGGKTLLYQAGEYKEKGG